MPRPGRMTTERAKDFKGTLRQLLGEMRRYRLSLAVVILFAIQIGRASCRERV